MENIKDLFANLKEKILEIIAIPGVVALFAFYVKIFWDLLNQPA